MLGRPRPPVAPGLRPRRPPRRPRLAGPTSTATCCSPTTRGTGIGGVDGAVRAGDRPGLGASGR
ncbi:hypothetical protein LT493_10050 [Streptomyces tricolor]|nr:hypothetical protein [Streptomyces tricolor]